MVSESERSHEDITAISTSQSYTFQPTLDTAREPRLEVALLRSEGL